MTSDVCESVSDLKLDETSQKDYSLILRANKLVDELYRFRDCYYENKEINSQISTQKIADVKEKMNQTVNSLKSLKWKKNEKCFHYLYIGKALNVVADFDKECQDNLSKAIKLNPKLSEAWFQLGECHWKNNDVEGAYNCFKSALEHQSDKHILRSISMVLRQLPATAEQKRERLTESLKNAKDALKLDMSDGKSWSILGSAYLNSFLSNPFNTKFMSHTLTAYQKAVKDPVAYADPDLHYNYGLALLYESQFGKTLREWCICSRLDSCWKFPKESLAQIILFLDCLKLAMSNKGKMKEKRFRQLLSSLKEPKSRMRDLGPYSDGMLGSSIVMRRVCFSELKMGTNSNMMVLTKVVCGAIQGDKLAHTVVVVDEVGSLLPIRLFNLALSRGPVIGDSIVIPEPFVDVVDVDLNTINDTFGELEKNPDIYKFDYKMVSDLIDEGLHQNVIRVSIPSILVVNGRKVNEKWTALPVVQNLYFTDNWLSALK